MSVLTESLLETQNDYEQRFNCVVCLCPRLQMVYGLCQHRLCVDCLYDEEKNLRPSMKKCPTCQMQGSFPNNRPDVPDDNIELMRCVGICKCTNGGCDMEMWHWELEDHAKTCPNRVTTPKTPSRRLRRKTESEKSLRKKVKEKEECVRETRSSRGIIRRLRSFRRSSTALI